MVRFFKSAHRQTNQTTLTREELEPIFPPEIWLQILFYADMKTLGRMARTSKLHQQLSRETQTTRLSSYFANLSITPAPVYSSRAELKLLGNFTLPNFSWHNQVVTCQLVQSQWCFTTDRQLTVIDAMLAIARRSLKVFIELEIAMDIREFLQAGQFKQAENTLKSYLVENSHLAKTKLKKQRALSELKHFRRYFYRAIILLLQYLKQDMQMLAENPDVEFQTVYLRDMNYKDLRMLHWLDLPPEQETPVFSRFDEAISLQTEYASVKAAYLQTRRVYELIVPRAALRQQTETLPANYTLRNPADLAVKMGAITGANILKIWRLDGIRTGKNPFPFAMMLGANRYLRPELGSNQAEDDGSALTLSPS